MNLRQILLGKEVGNIVDWNLKTAIQELKSYRFEVADCDEDITFNRFYDIGAIVYYLKVIPWIIDDFSFEKYFKELEYIDEHIKEKGYFDMMSEKFIIIARK